MKHIASDGRRISTVGKGWQSLTGSLGRPATQHTKGPPSFSIFRLQERSPFKCRLLKAKAIRKTGESMGGQSGVWAMRRAGRGWRDEFRDTKESSAARLPVRIYAPAGDVHALALR